MALGAGSHRSGTPGGPPPGARLTRKPPVSAAGRGRSRLRQPVSPLDYLGAETGVARDTLRAWRLRMRPFGGACDEDPNRRRAGSPRRRAAV